MADGSAAAVIAGEDMEAVKAQVREFLRLNFFPVEPKTRASGKLHLEVWRSKERRRPVGVELGHATLVNFWVIDGVDEPKEMPASILFHRKRAIDGGKWTDDEGDGANSNLSAYAPLRGSDLVRLGARTWADAELILETLAW